MDTSHLCRSCMKELASWERDSFDKRVSQMYTFCTNIEVMENDNLPKKFCYDCAIKIESSYSYIQEAQRVNSTLLSIVNQRSVIVEINRQADKLPTLEYPEVDESIFEFNEIPDLNVPSTDVTPVAEEKLETERKISDSIRSGENVTGNDNYVCAICKKTFLSKVWFEKHMKNQHGGKKYTCAQCPKTFQKPSQLSVHAVTHSDERKYACACGKRYKRRKELTIHARTHADDRPYQCDHCHMSFKLKSVLKSHMVLHQPDKPHLCYVCGWKFSQAGNLLVHMRTHTGDKPYECTRCGFRAAAASNLRRHERRHRALRPYRCRTCRKAFYDKSALTRHERSHTGARPYQCPGCARAFADSWKRKTHLVRAHKLPLQRIPRMRADPTLDCAPYMLT